MLSSLRSMPRSAVSLALLLVVASLLACSSVSAGTARCSNYNADCQACADAPDALNCGWCADSQQCLSGSMTGPAAAAGTCSAASWGFKTDSCQSTQARCNQAGTDCATCTADLGCGWCGGTGRCLNGTTTGASPLACTSQWSYTVDTCAAPNDPCTEYVKCGDCSNAAYNQNCGWCASTGLCRTGSSSGPSASNCSAVAWTFQSCPCSEWSEDGCQGCSSNSGCGWCGSDPDDGSCLSGYGSAEASGCSSEWTFGSDTCPAAAPHVSEKTGVTVMVIVGVFSAVALVLYSFSCWWAPTMGSRLAGGGVRNFATGSMRGLPFVLATLSFCFKMAAMTADRWSRATLELDGVSYFYNFGVLAMRFHGNGQSIDTTYADFCKEGEDEDGISSASCRQVRWGGGLVILLGALTLASGLALLMLSFVSLLKSEKLTGLVMRLWRLSGLAEVCSGASLAMWFFGVQLVFDHESGGHLDVSLGTSWALMCAGWVFDVVLLLFYRQAVRCTLDPTGAGLGPATHSLDAYPVFASESSYVPPAAQSNPSAAYHRMGQ